MIVRRPSKTGDGEAKQPLENEDWLDELVIRWTDVYKKSMTTLVLVRLVEEQGPIAAGGLRAAYSEATGWDVTERGLYRTLKRITDDGLIQATEIDAARTGAKRKDLTITALGMAFLRNVEKQLLP